MGWGQKKGKKIKLDVFNKNLFFYVHTDIFQALKLIAFFVVATQLIVNWLPDSQLLHNYTDSTKMILPDNL